MKLRAIFIFVSQFIVRETEDEFLPQEENKQSIAVEKIR